MRGGPTSKESTRYPGGLDLKCGGWGHAKTKLLGQPVFGHRWQRKRERERAGPSNWLTWLLIHCVFFCWICLSLSVGGERKIGIISFSSRVTFPLQSGAVALFLRHLRVSQILSSRNQDETPRTSTFLSLLFCLFGKRRRTASSTIQQIFPPGRVSVYLFA